MLLPKLGLLQDSFVYRVEELGGLMAMISGMGQKENCTFPCDSRGHPLSSSSCSLSLKSRQLKWWLHFASDWEWSPEVV